MSRQIRRAPRRGAVGARRRSAGGGPDGVKRAHVGLPRVAPASGRACICAERESFLRNPVLTSHTKIWELGKKDVGPQRRGG